MLLLAVLVGLIQRAGPGDVPRAEAVWVDPDRLVVDGDPSEWRRGAAPVVVDAPGQLVSIGPPVDEHWLGSADLSTELWIGWNASDLILGGRVRDDLVAHDPSSWFRGDSIEVFLNTRDREPEWGLDDFQVMLAPNWPERPWGVYSRPGQNDVGAGHGGFGGVVVACLPEQDGYRFEARLPWKNFAELVPSEGLVLPFNLALCDRDDRGEQDSYMTWTGEPGIAQHADRRGELVLRGPVPLGTSDGLEAGAGASELRGMVPLVLAVAFGIALWTRRAWRRPRWRRIGLLGALGVLGASLAVALAMRVARAAERAELEARLQRYGGEVEDLVRRGGLGHPEPAELVRAVRSLFAGESVAAVEVPVFRHFRADGGELGPVEVTTRRGHPFRRMLGEVERVRIEPGTARRFELDGPHVASALQLVTRVQDERWRAASQRPVTTLEVTALRGFEAVGPTMILRHRRDLVLETSAPNVRPGQEPAFFESGGRRGRLHASAHLIELEAHLEVDAIELRHVGGGVPYAVDLVAAAAVCPVDEAPVPAPLRADPAGGWSWPGWADDILATVASTSEPPDPQASSGRQDAGESDELVVERRFGSGSDDTVRVELRPTARSGTGTRWDVLPIGTAILLAPFVVVILAEALATRRRIRFKLAVGFAVSSAVPLLALTTLLEASLEAEHQDHEADRVQGALVRAEREFDQQLAELEATARHYLAIAELRSAEGRLPASTSAIEPPPAFPRTEAELDQWLGARPPDEVRLVELVDRDGRRRRIGSGPQWRQVERSAEPSTAFVRSWGRLMARGVAQSQGGAEFPISVTVLRVPRVSEASDVTLLGAGDDRQPVEADLVARAGEALRRPLWGPDGELVGVWIAPQRPRGTPFLFDFSLTELVLAAGVLAVFTAMLFAGVLTSHIVQPIERLDRSVREGLPDPLEIGVHDEVGHLTNAIQTFAGELAHRVDQLESLQEAQRDMTSRLDPAHAQRTILTFFAARTGARAFLIDAGSEAGGARLVDVAGRSRAIPYGRGFLGLALVAGEVLHLVLDEELGGLLPEERAGFDGARRLLVLPLVLGGSSRGAIVLAFESADEPADLAFLETVASQAGVVLENARLYQTAVEDPVTGFLSDAGFQRRLADEIARAEAIGDSVVVGAVRLQLPRDDQAAEDRLREAALRMRRAVHGIAFFGRAQTSFLYVAVPSAGTGLQAAGLARRLQSAVGQAAWPDGADASDIAVAAAAWPTDGASARFVLAALEERIAEAEPGRARRPDEVLGEDRLPEDFVAESPLMLDLLETVRRLARQEITVLVAGETGVGKDRVAELLHRWSGRDAGPLVHVHCPSLPDSLIEDELFGHEAGAFTGAERRRTGPFEYAAGGTIVLDEVGGLSAEGQVALLRVLENREVLPLGAVEPVAIDVRIVATTSRDLSREVEEGRFRRDLYFRLNLAHVTVPPLRLRKAALPALVERHLQRFNAQAKRPMTGIAPAALDRLFGHDWPGNLRELENVMTRAFVLADGGELAPEHLEIGRLDPVSQPDLSDRQRAILAELPVDTEVTSAEVARALGVSSRTALRDLQRLVDAGLVARRGSKRGTRFRRPAAPQQT